MVGVIFGLAAALGWGVADFFARFASQRVGAYRTLLYAYPVAFLGLTVYVFLTELDNIANWEWWALGLTVLLAAGNVLAGLALYHAFTVGVLSLVSPIAASYGALVLILSIVFSGERPSGYQFTGLILTLIGVVISSTRLGPLPESEASGGRLAQGVLWAVGASVCFGVVFWGLRFVTPSLGGVIPIWEVRLAGSLLLLALARPIGQSIKPPDRQSWLWIVGVALVDTLAFIAYTLGIHLSGQTGTVAVLSSLFSAVTILLARLFLKEKLEWSQWGGIGLILVGVGLVSLV